MNSVQLVTAGLAIVLGALVCFLGYRLIRVTVAIAGFLVGAALGWWAVSLVSGAAQVFAIVAALVCGILGTVLAILLYKVGVFLLGAGAGALVAGLVAVSVGGVPSSLILIAAGVVGGAVTLLLERPLVSVLTAFAGAWAVVGGAFQLAGRYEMSAGYGGLARLRASGTAFLVLLGLWVLFGIVGSMVQLRHGKK